MKKDDRLGELTQWVRQIEGLADARPEPASADASFRRYYRIHDGMSYIVMDAPPPQEDCGAFVQVAGFLENMGLNSPRVIESAPAHGFLLLTDLGSVPYLDAINTNPGAAADLYKDAIDALIVIQSRGRYFQQQLPAYDEHLLRLELSLFHDWLCQTHLGLLFSAADEVNWRASCDALVDCALEQARVFVHRDFHSRNLMVTGENNPGILDFQDAVEGPYTYDLVSLLKDCYVKWPAEVTAERAMCYFRHMPAQFGKPDADRFMRDFDLMGVQRHLKAAGIFARLLHRDGKSGYLQDVPRTLSYVCDIAPGYAELEFIAALIGERVLPALHGAA